MYVLFHYCYKNFQFCFIYATILYIYNQFPLFRFLGKDPWQITEFFFTSAFPEYSWEITVGHFQLQQFLPRSYRLIYWKMLFRNFTEIEMNNHVSKPASISSLIKTKLYSPLGLLDGICVVMSSYSIHSFSWETE